MRSVIDRNFVMRLIHVSRRILLPYRFVSVFREGMIRGPAEKFCLLCHIFDQNNENLYRTVSTQSRDISPPPHVTLNSQLSITPVQCQSKWKAVRTRRLQSCRCGVTNDGEKSLLSTFHGLLQAVYGDKCVDVGTVRLANVPLFESWGPKDGKQECQCQGVTQKGLVAVQNSYYYCCCCCCCYCY